MMDVLGRMVSFLIGAVMLFIVPLTIITLKNDDVHQTRIDDAVVEFVDNARASGEISEEAYRTLYRKINMEQESCDISIAYESYYSVPATGVGVEGYVLTSEVNNQNDISLYLYSEHDSNGNILYDAHGAPIPYGKNQPASNKLPDGRVKRYPSYPLKTGGYLHVEVLNRNSTLGSRMVRLFIPGYAGRAIHSSYGGYVGNMGRE